ncbi:MAG: NUDIX hydrolase [Bacteroidota bacterium]
MENIIRTAGVLAFQNRKVLLVRHGKKAQHLNDTFGIPAGRIQLNETAIDAAVREFNEESGLTTSVEHLTKLPTTYTAKIERKDGVKNFSLEAFLCRKYEGELKSTDEAISEWVRMDDLEGLKLLPNMKEVIMEASKLEQNNR